MLETFEKAAHEATVLKQRPTKDEMSALYGFYKQATVGDVNIDRPGFLNIIGRGKWEAWNEKKGMCKEDAMAAYVDVVEKLKEKYGMETQ